MALILPATPDGNANFDFIVELGGADYRFAMRYNSRDSNWYFSLYDASGNPLAQGLKLVLNVDLTVRVTVEGAFVGRVYVLDGRRFPQPATIASLGTDQPMVYDDSGEVA